MVSERGVKISHTIIFTIVLLASVVALGLSGYLVGHYNSGGYPPVHTTEYKDRIRILLVAAVWMTAFAIILIVGFQTMGNHLAFGVLTHLIPTVFGFILFLVGASSLTALTDKIDCGKSGQGFSKCDTVKGLVVISWIDTIFITIAMIFILVLAITAHRGYGMHKSTLYVD